MKHNSFIYGALWGAMGCDGVLWGFMGCYGALESVMGWWLWRGEQRGGRYGVVVMGWSLRGGGRGLRCVWGSLGAAPPPQFLHAGSPLREEIAAEVYEDEVDARRSGLSSSIASAWSERSFDPDDIRVGDTLGTFF